VTAVQRVPVALWRDFAADLFRAAGVAESSALQMAEGFLQADLLGFHTHGLSLLRFNLDCIRRGMTRIAGEPAVLSGRGAVLNADADYLAGPLAMGWACEQGIARAREHGVAVLTLRKCQHIGALAPYLLRIAEAGFAAFAMVATPEESLVTVEGAREPLFSTNPFGFAFPTEADPLLLDMSLAVTAAGQVRVAQAEGHRLPGAWLLDADGLPTDDPAALAHGMLLPVGGTDHGHKGSGLLVWSEMFAACLGGWGRLDRTGDDDANSLYLAVHDPEAFGGDSLVRRQASRVVELYQALQPRTGAEAPRLPGQRALALRRAALSDGLALPARISTALLQLAQEWQVSPPAEIAAL
jgi:L-lactate dehydrogenase